MTTAFAMQVASGGVERGESRGSRGRRPLELPPVGGPFPEVRRFSAVFQKPYGRNRYPTAHPAPSAPRQPEIIALIERGPILGFLLSPGKSTDGRRGKGPSLGFCCKGRYKCRVCELRLVVESERVRRPTHGASLAAEDDSDFRVVISAGTAEQPRPSCRGPHRFPNARRAKHYPIQR